MNKCHRTSWEGHDAGSPVGDSLLPLSVSVQCFCSALQKRSFISPNTGYNKLWSRELFVVMVNLFPQQLRDAYLSTVLEQVSVQV